MLKEDMQEEHWADGSLAEGRGGVKMGGGGREVNQVCRIDTVVNIDGVKLQSYIDINS